jgi:hypothetical protein
MLQDGTYAQAIAYYSGIVKNTDNQPIENVSINSTGAENVFTTADGKFLLSFNELLQDSGGTAYAKVYFVHPDYVTASKSILIAQGDSLTGDTIIMHPNTHLYTISGKVTYQNGDPVKISEVAFFNVNDITNYSFITYADIEGNYLIQVPAGSYYIRSRASYRQGLAWAYRYKYYNDSENLKEANILEVTADIPQLNFIHRQLPLGSISGKVIDAQTLQPVENAEVSVVSMPLTDSSFMGTDAEGKFTIQVFEGVYKIYAYKTGYRKIFYNHAYDLFDATPVEIIADKLDVTGIDFTLTSPDVGTNTISGEVLDESTGLPLRDFEVIAAPLLRNGQRLSSEISDKNNSLRIQQGTDFNGIYTLKNLQSGNYVLLFYKEGYLSTFNGSVFEWEKAPLVELTGNTNVTIIQSMKKSNPFGAEVTGVILSILSSTRMGGTLVSLIDESGEVAASNFSEYDGTFHVPFINNGNYTIKASWVGLPTTEVKNKINVDLNSSLQINNVEIILSNQTGVEEDKIPSDFKLAQNYPNPFNPSTVINYQLPVNSKVTLKIFNSLGEEVKTLVNEYQDAGLHSALFTLNSSLPSGIYFYRIQAGNSIQTNKMMLLK